MERAGPDAIGQRGQGDVADVERAAHQLIHQDLARRLARRELGSGELAGGFLQEAHDAGRADRPHEAELRGVFTEL